LNIKELEIQAKALAPVIVSAINKAIEALRAEMMLHMAEMSSEMMMHMEKMESSMPMDGKDGMPGRDGKDGKDGADGKDGMDGTSISMDDMMMMIKEEIARQMDAIEKPTNGIDGINGIDGQDGRDGKDGQSGINGKDGINGTHGRDGIDGINGKDGANGINGRDALQLEIMPAIDEAKSYPRGTYAKYNGGLWRSFESTIEMRGWECIVDGIAGMNIEQNGERSFKAIALLSSGIMTEKSITIPVQIYRGVWKHGGYEQGDTVTWAGSQWHCDEATEDKPGEAGSKGWKLCVKRGSNGKDGINGKDAAGVVRL
jgi:hypothetical protein